MLNLTSCDRPNKQSFSFNPAAIAKNPTILFGSTFNINRIHITYYIVDPISTRTVFQYLRA